MERTGIGCLLYPLVKQGSSNVIFTADITSAFARCFCSVIKSAPSCIYYRLYDLKKSVQLIVTYPCLELTAYEAQYRIPWIVFDRDQVIGFDEIISEAEKKGIQVGWSNPCFEIWMYAYFGAMPAIQDSWTCCSEFGRVYESKTGQKYSKADEKMYGKISNAGNEEKAIQIAQQKLEQCEREGKKKPSEMCPGTTVHKLVAEIRGKRKEGLL